MTDTRIVILGGGFSGVEVAGEITDFLHASLKYYPVIDPADCQVTLLHAGDRILPELSPGLSEFALRKMRRRGLDIRLNARAARIDARTVELQDGERITGGTIICTIGTTPNPLIDSLPVSKVRVFFEWNWGMLFPADIAHLGFSRTKRNFEPPPVKDTETRASKQA